jgi:hypothetical protein
MWNLQSVAAVTTRAGKKSSRSKTRGILELVGRQASMLFPSENLSGSNQWTLGQGSVLKKSRLMNNMQGQGRGATLAPSKTRSHTCHTFSLTCLNFFLSFYILEFVYASVAI